eukprot:6195606-Pleurochrysis_carterae.AAC.3
MAFWPSPTVYLPSHPSAVSRRVCGTYVAGEYHSAARIPTCGGRDAIADEAARVVARGLELRRSAATSGASCCAPSIMFVSA